VAAVKRNSSSGISPDRLVLPLELPGREDGHRALALLQSGLVTLPSRIRNAAESGRHKPVGDGFRRLLERTPYWVSLVERTPGLTPYGLRHGFAWRGANRQPSIPLRDLAAVMGHTPATHLKHYGRWTAEADLIASFATAPSAVIDATQPNR
jgi:integrase